MRQAKFCLGWSGDFSRGSPVLAPPGLKMSKIILTGCKTQIKKKRKIILQLYGYLCEKNQEKLSNRNFQANIFGLPTFEECERKIRLCRLLDGPILFDVRISSYTLQHLVSPLILFCYVCTSGKKTLAPRVSPLVYLCLIFLDFTKPHRYIYMYIGHDLRNSNVLAVICCLIYCWLGVSC